MKITKRQRARATEECRLMASWSHAIQDDYPFPTPPTPSRLATAAFAHAEINQVAGELASALWWLEAAAMLEEGWAP